MKNLLIVMLLLAVCSACCATPEKTIFGIAARGTASELQKTLKLNGDVNAVDKWRRTPLSYAAEYNNGENISVLLKAGAEIGHKDMFGMTPLMWAVTSANSKVAVLSALIRAGAKINDRNHLGMTPLMIAAEYNRNPDVLIRLLSLGADCKARDNEGKTALDYIKENSALRDSEAYQVLKVKSGDAPPPEHTVPISHH